MREQVTLNGKEQKRLKVLNDLDAGLSSPKKRRAPKRHPRRGMLVQIDGSKHDWLEGRGPMLTLIAGIDDATSEMPAALFRPEEDAAGYFPLLRHIIERVGLPLGLYTDLHTIFRSPKKITLDYAGQSHDGALEE